MKLPSGAFSHDEADTPRQPASRLDLSQPSAALGCVASNDGGQPSARCEPLGEIVDGRSPMYQTPEGAQTID
jgi:hypothetical protein